MLEQLGVHYEPNILTVIGVLIIPFAYPLASLAT